MVPQSAIVVFETEEARKLMLKRNRTLKIAGKSLDFDPCPEPTDIIWENRTKKSRFFKFLYGTIILAILFSLDLYSNFKITDVQQDYVLKYDTHIDC